MSDRTVLSRVITDRSLQDDAIGLRQSDHDDIEARSDIELGSVRQTRKPSCKQSVSVVVH